MKGFFLRTQNKQLALSLLLLWLCYWVFGWIFAASIPRWTSLLTEKITVINLPLSITYLSWWIRLLGICLVFLMIITLISPLGFISMCFGGFLESDQKALISLLIWGIIFVILIGCFEFFVRLSVLFSAGLLARLDLQNHKFHKKQASLILIVVAVTAFSSGLFCFSYWG
jgi:hypothetical protein